MLVTSLQNPCHILLQFIIYAGDLSACRTYTYICINRNLTMAEDSSLEVGEQLSHIAINGGLSYWCHDANEFFA